MATGAAGKLRLERHTLGGGTAVLLRLSLRGLARLTTKKTRACNVSLTGRSALLSARYRSLYRADLAGEFEWLNDSAGHGAGCAVQLDIGTQSAD